MNYKYYLKSDIGTTHSVNQDSAFALVKNTALGKAFIGVVCDGMGGMSDGDYASSLVSDTLSEWFSEFSPVDSAIAIQDQIFPEWETLITRCNRDLYELGVNQHAAMGTTLSVLLLINHEYFITQLGDSRVYHQSGDSLVQITRDHSYVMDMVQKGMMTEREAFTSKQRNILTKCIGCTGEVTADFYCGTVERGDIFLMSTDGFHSGTDLEEIGSIIAPARVLRHSGLKNSILSAIDERKRSGEKDNITALAVQLT